MDKSNRLADENEVNEQAGKENVSRTSTTKRLIVWILSAILFLLVVGALFVILRFKHSNSNKLVGNHDNIMIARRNGTRS